MNALLSIISGWLDIYPWLMPSITMFTFLLVGLVVYVEGYMKLRMALIVGGSFGVFMIGFVYLAEYLIRIGFLS